MNKHHSGTNPFENIKKNVAYIGGNMDRSPYFMQCTDGKNNYEFDIYSATLMMTDIQNGIVSSHQFTLWETEHFLLTVKELFVDAVMHFLRRFRNSNLCAQWNKTQIVCGPYSIRKTRTIEEAMSAKTIVQVVAGIEVLMRIPCEKPLSEFLNCCDSPKKK